MDAILRRIGVVGEAASRVAVVDREQFLSIEWREIIGMRQHVVHGYDKIDLDILDGMLRADRSGRSSTSGGLAELVEGQERPETGLKDPGFVQHEFAHR